MPKLIMLITVAISALWCEIGTLYRVNGDVAVTRNGSKIDAKRGMPIEKRDIVQTGKKSSAIIRLKNKTIVSIGSESRFDFSVLKNTESDDTTVSTIEESLIRKEKIIPSTMAIGVRSASKNHDRVRSEDTRRYPCIHKSPSVFKRHFQPKWTSICANGSVVKYRYGSEKVQFAIRRLDRGPKSDIDTHGYAYLLSNAITIPKKWKKITFEGRWWQKVFRKSNYEEMLIYVTSRYPIPLHGKKNGNMEARNYIEVGYDTWHKTIRFSRKGKNGTASIASMRRSAPLAPVPFRLVIKRLEMNGDYIEWEFLEKRYGKWQSIYREIQKGLFEDTEMDRIYIKIGGWTTWEYPITSFVEFDSLSCEITGDEDRGYNGSDCLPLEPPYKRSGRTRYRDGMSNLHMHKRYAGKTKKTIDERASRNDSLQNGNGYIFEYCPKIFEKVPWITKIETKVSHIGNKNTPKASVFTAYSKLGVKVCSVKFRDLMLKNGWKRTVAYGSVAKGFVEIFEKGKNSIQIVISPFGSGSQLSIACGEKIGR